jgi:DNA-binding transcriptional LysR family regulator
MRKPAPIDLRSIRYLLAVVEEGSFARAAEKLKVTQPALSRSVQALERLLGAKLLDRGRAGVTSTVFGQLLVERGRALLSDAAAITREIDLLRGAETGAISVGVGAYPAEISAGPAAARMLTERPGVKVRITIGDWPKLTENVLTEKLDLAICELAGAERNPRVVVEPLPAHQGVLFCRSGHPLATRKSVTLDEVQEFPLALTALPERLAALVAGQSRRDGRVLVPAVHVDTFQLARTIVLGSDTIGAATAPQLDEDVRSGRVTILPIELPWLVTRYGFIYLAGRTLAPSLRMFMDAVRAIENELRSRAPSAGKRRKSSP